MKHKLYQYPEYTLDQLECIKVQLNFVKENSCE